MLKNEDRIKHRAVMDAVRRTGVARSVSAMFAWLHNFARRDLAEPEAREHSVWDIYVFGLRGKITEPPTKRTLDDILPDAPGIADDRLADVRDYVARLLRALRADVAGTAILPASFTFRIRRVGESVTVDRVGDVEARFFSRVVELLESVAPRLADCQAPHCHRVFVAPRRGAKYCSTRCQNRATGTRYRKRLAQAERP